MSVRAPIVPTALSRGAHKPTTALLRVPAVYRDVADGSKFVLVPAL